MIKSLATLLLLATAGCASFQNSTSERSPAAAENSKSVFEVLKEKDNLFANCRCVDLVSSKDPKRNCSNISAEEKRQMDEMKMYLRFVKSDAWGPKAYGTSTPYGSISIDPTKPKINNVILYQTDFSNIADPKDKSSMFSEAYFQQSTYVYGMTHNYIANMFNTQSLLNGVEKGRGRGSVHIFRRPPEEKLFFAAQYEDLYSGDSGTIECSTAQ